MRLGLALALLLSGCASQDADRIRTHLVGQSEVAAIACLGPPAHERRMTDGSEVLSWDRTTKGASASLPLASLAVLPVASALSLAEGNLSVTGDGDCKAVARVVGGRVVSLVYAGASGGISGPDAECKSLVRGCSQ